MNSWYKALDCNSFCDCCVINQARDNSKNNGDCAEDLDCNIIIDKFECGLLSENLWDSTEYAKFFGLDIMKRD